MTGFFRWLPDQGSNLDSSDPESDVLPVTPSDRKIKWRNSFHHFTISPFRGFFCGIDWNRTSDARIFSPSLYRLSYDAISDLEVQIYEDFFILQQFHPGAKISLRILHTFAG